MGLFFGYMTAIPGFLTEAQRAQRTRSFKKWGFKVESITNYQKRMTSPCALPITFSGKGFFYSLADYLLNVFGCRLIDPFYIFAYQLINVFCYHLIKPFHFFVGRKRIYKQFIDLSLS